MRKSGFTLSAFIILAALWISAAAMAQTQSAGGAPAGGENAVAEEGSETKVEILTSIGFNGNTKFSDKQLMDVIGMKVGDNLTKEMIGAAIQNIVDLYRNNGANLSISPNVNPGKGVATIEFMIDESGTKGDAGPYQGGSKGGDANPGGLPDGAGGQGIPE